MARISKKRLKPETREKVQKHFVKTIANIHSSVVGESFLESIFSTAEIEMLTKRFAALLMLAQGISPYRVHKLLNMSSTTMHRMQKELDVGKHPYIISLTKKKKEREKIWAELEVLVRLGMPEMGKNRWDWLNKI